MLPSDELNAFACGGHLVVVTTFAIAELPARELAGVLAHELSHHLGMHTVGADDRPLAVAPVVLLARVGFLLQNVATAATEAFAARVAGAGRCVGQLVAGVLNVLSLPFVAALLRRRRARQRRRPPHRVPGRPAGGAHGLRAATSPRRCAG